MYLPAKHRTQNRTLERRPDVTKYARQYLALDLGPTDKQSLFTANGPEFKLIVLAAISGMYWKQVRQTNK